MGKIDKNWLASIGISAEDLAQAAEPQPIHKDVAPKQQANIEANSTLRALNWPHDQLMPVRCWECQEIFLTNYNANVYCSQQCFKDGLAKKGIKWRPDRTLSEQWGGYEPPMHIPPGALEVMRHLIRLADSGNLPQPRNPEPGFLEELSTPEPSVEYDLPNPSNDPDIQEEQEDWDDGFLAVLDVPLE